MPSTTLERVRAAAGHLAAVPDARLEIFLEDAIREVAALNPKEEDRERLERYLVLHFASIKDRSVTKERLVDLEKTYAASSGEGILSTPYGAEFNRLVSELGLKGKKRGLNLLVL